MFKNTEETGGTASETAKYTLRGHIQQNAFNTVSDNSEILLVQNLRRIVIRPEILLFTPQKINETSDNSDMFPKLWNDIWTRTAMVSPNPLSPSPSTLPTMKTPENIEENPNDPEPTDDGNIQMETPLSSCMGPRRGAVSKNTCKKVHQGRQHRKG